MRKLIVAVLALVAATGIGFVTTASVAPQPSALAPATCAHFQDPTVELVWSHVCHF
jgi:hypothetical protein